MATVKKPTSVNQLLSGIQGRYEWGKRDCLTTAVALIEYFLGEGRAPDIAIFHAMTEPQAYKLAVRRYGSYRKGLKRVLSGQRGVSILSGGENAVTPGDIVIMGGIIDVAGTKWDTSKKGVLLGYVTDEYEIMHWYPYGLRRTTGEFEILEVIRCRKP